MTTEQKLERALKLLEPLIYYSQIHTVKGVQPVEFHSHEYSWREAQNFLWNEKGYKDGWDLEKYK